MKLPILHNTRIHTPRGTLGIFIVALPGDRSSLILDASLAIPTRVLRFEASRHTRISPLPAEPPILVFWRFLAQPSNPTVLW
jgi:hypothetical protein